MVSLFCVANPCHRTRAKRQLNAGPEASEQNAQEVATDDTYMWGLRLHELQLEALRGSDGQHLCGIDAHGTRFQLLRFLVELEPERRDELFTFLRAEQETNTNT